MVDAYRWPASPDERISRAVEHLRGGVLFPGARVTTGLHWVNRHGTVRHLTVCAPGDRNIAREVADITGLRLVADGAAVRIEGFGEDMGKRLVADVSRKMGYRDTPLRQEWV